jgi:hypothetical protein
MPDLEAAVLAYGALLDEELIHGSSPERDAAIAKAHHAALVARHAEGGCGFCIPAEPDDVAAFVAYVHEDCRAVPDDATIPIDLGTARAITARLEG